MTSILNFNPPVIAHRGASAYAPENTLAAFTKAAQLNIKWVEFDVMQAAKGEPIIFHDETLDRTTNGRGQVFSYPYSYLQTLDAGKWFNVKFSGERIPTLEQVMEFLRMTKMNANVEIKALPKLEEEQVNQIANLMQPYLNQQDYTIVFSSFSFNTLFLLRQLLPNCLIGLLLHEWEPNWQEIAKELDCVSIHVNHEILTQEAAASIKKMNKYLLSYTVNDPHYAQKLFSWGVDAVFSDVPDIIANLRR